MDIYIHYPALPAGMTLPDVVGQLNEALDDAGIVNGGLEQAVGGRIDLDLEDERVNPKYAQLAVKAYLQKARFPKGTFIEIGGMETEIYE